MRTRLQQKLPVPVRLNATTFYGSRFVVGPDAGSCTDDDYAGTCENKDGSSRAKTRMLNSPNEQFQESFPAFFHYHHLKGKITDCSPKLPQILGQVRNQIAGKEEASLVLQLLIADDCVTLVPAADYDYGDGDAEP